MKKIFANLLLGLIFLAFTASEIMAQNPQYPQVIMKGKPIVCPAGTKSVRSYIPPPTSFLNRDVTRTEAGATIVVDYVGFDNQPEAKTAFQFAVDIWASKLKSPVTIYVKANWRGLGDGVLGSASPGTFYANFQGATFLRTFYPVALAEKMAGKDLNTVGQPDIEANFNSQFQNWYFGTDGNTPSDKYDFVSVVLHELGHGLGFFSGGRYESSTDQGSMRFSGALIVFDHYMEDETGKALKDVSLYPDPSSALGLAFRKALYFDAPLVFNNNSNQRAILYSPAQFDDGSSVSHLDQATYEGTINGLMSPQANLGTAEHDPGPITSNMFAEMGWVHTYLQPDTIKSTETVASNFLVKTKAFSDVGIDASSLKLYYSLDSFKTAPTELAMSATGSTNEYQATIPSVASGTTVGYYLKVNSTDSRTYFSPAEPTNLSNYFYFYVGPDNIAPKITHTPVGFILLPSDTLRIEANITDLFDIEKAEVEYKINEGTTTKVTMTRDKNDRNLFVATIKFPVNTLKNEDKVSYRIITNDKSVAKNSATLPSTNFYVTEVKGLKPVQDTYKTDFSGTTVADDFVGTSFSIAQPTGFNNPAIHSEHPYKDGSGANDESNYIMQLRVPIKVSATNPLMRFDEIVLVEPGEAGSVFGQAAFYDYAVVEGSKDGGVTWTPIGAGYDATANPAWESAYNGAITNNNSTAVGTPELYKPRVLDLSKVFAVGDEVVIRFRLFADQAAHGWGWSIDNLQIQGDLSAFVTAIEPETLTQNQAVKLYPNPTEAVVFLEMPIRWGVQSVRVHILNEYGVLVGEKYFSTVEQDDLQAQISLEDLPSGTYFIKILAGKEQTIRKIILQK